MADAAVDLQPTAERVRRILSVDPERVVRPQVDQKTSRKAWRIKPIMETMRDNDQLSETAYRAFVTFEGHYDAGIRDPFSCIAKYGSAVAQGTPIGQMLADAMERAEFREVKRMNAADRCHAALVAVGRDPCRRALMMAVTMDTDLASIGAACSKFRTPSQARAVAVTLLQEACYDLQLHYDPGERG